MSSSRTLLPVSWNGKTSLELFHLGGNTFIERPDTGQFNSFKGQRSSILSPPFLGLLFPGIIFLAIEEVLYGYTLAPSQRCLMVKPCQSPSVAYLNVSCLKPLRQSFWHPVKTNLSQVLFMASPEIGKGIMSILRDLYFLYFKLEWKWKIDSC